MFKFFQKINECSSEVVFMDFVFEWLSLMSFMEKDIVNLYRYSNFSGYCFVEVEIVEDKEIQRINEYFYRKEFGLVLSDCEFRVLDFGILRDLDQFFCLFGEIDVVVIVEIVEIN